MLKDNIDGVIYRVIYHLTNGFHVFSIEEDITSISKCYSLTGKNKYTAEDIFIEISKEIKNSLFLSEDLGVLKKTLNEALETKNQNYLGIIVNINKHQHNTMIFRQIAFRYASEHGEKFNNYVAISNDSEWMPLDFPGKNDLGFINKMEKLKKVTGFQKLKRKNRA